MTNNWDDHLQDMKCNQIILVLKDDVSLLEAEKLSQVFKMIKFVQAAIPNVVERRRDGF